MNAQAKLITDRWNTFVDKVTQRWKEILAEADVGFDEIMHTEIVDPAAMSGAVGAFESRVHSLQDKISQAFEKIEQELDALIQDTEDNTESASLIQIRSRIQEHSFALQANIKQDTEILRSHKDAKAARLLEQVAQREMKTPQKCSHCGAEIISPTPYQASSVTCTHCQSVNSVLPGIATGMYFQGGALHHLAHEAALPEWSLMTKEEKRYQSLRHKTADDLARFEKTTADYWKKYCQTQGSLHPNWTEENIQKEFQGKMAHFYQSVTKVDQVEREQMTIVLQFAKNKDAQSAITWLKQNRKSPGSFAESAGEAAYERKDQGATQFLLEIAYQLQSPTESKSEWISEKNQDLQRYIKTIQS